MTRLAADGEAEEDKTEVESSQPQLLTLTPTPPPTTPSRNSRYHPCKFISTPALIYTHIWPDTNSLILDRPTPTPKTPFGKFKPPARYAKGVLSQNTSQNDPCNTPVSPRPSTSSTVVNNTTPTPRLASEPINLVSTTEEVARPRQLRILLGKRSYAHKPSQWTLEGIANILLEDGHVQSGVWALLPSDIFDAGDELAADLSIPILDLGTQTLEKIRLLLRQDGFAQNGILVLKMDNPGNDPYDEMGMDDIRAWF